MTTKIIEYEMPLTIPHGKRNRLAEIMGVHPNTIDNIRKSGKSHPLYNKLVNCVLQVCGKPIKTETV
jgi:hypothetical protein